MERHDKPVTMLLTKTLLAKLKGAAKRNGRTVSGEARFAISKHVQKEKPE